MSVISNLSSQIFFQRKVSPGTTNRLNLIRSSFIPIFQIWGTTHFFSAPPISRCDHSVQIQIDDKPDAVKCIRHFFYIKKYCIMVKERFVKIGDKEWRLRMADDGRINFSYVKPKVWGEDPYDSLWQDWFNPDSRHYGPTYCYSETGFLEGHSPFKVKDKIMNCMAGLIRQSGKPMFYFEAIDPKRGRIYSNLVNEFIERLGGGWSCQVIGNYWFYFTKENLWELN